MFDVNQQVAGDTGGQCQLFLGAALGHPDGSGCAPRPAVGDVSGRGTFGTGLAGRVGTTTKDPTASTLVCPTSYTLLFVGDAHCPKEDTL